MITFITRHKKELQKAGAGLFGLVALLVLWGLLARNYHPLILPRPWRPGGPLPPCGGRGAWPPTS